MGRMEKRTVLVVIPERGRREEVASWIEGEHDTMTCPGPQGPEACLGLRGPRCPLAGAADLVILDMGEADDPIGGTVAGWELLNAYLDQGLPVIALASPGDTMMRGSRNAVVPLPRTAGRQEIVRAVDRAMAATV